jgi:hypothetical protein
MTMNLRTVVSTLAAVCLLTGATAAAQAPPAEPAAPPVSNDTRLPVRPLTKYNFHLSSGALTATDENFDWTADFGGDLDLLDFGTGRLNFLANYEVVLGTEFKNFDPNQGNYTLDGTLAFRVYAGDVAVVFHHISRHFGDRAKLFAVDWNSLGVKTKQTFKLGKGRVTAHAWFGKIVEHAYVDYTWEGEAGAEAELPLSPMYSMLVRGSANTFGVDHAIAARNRQNGGHAEVALRILGTGAIVELFTAYEKRIDALPIARESRHWAVAGFRLLSR